MSAAEDEALLRQLKWGPPGILIDAGDHPVERWDAPPFGAIRVRWSALREVRVREGVMRVDFEDRRIPRTHRFRTRLQLPRAKVRRFERFVVSFFDALEEHAPDCTRVFEPAPVDPQRMVLDWNDQFFTLPMLDSDATIRWARVRQCTPEDEWPQLAFAWWESARRERDGRPARKEGERFAFLGTGDQHKELVESFAFEVARRLPDVFVERGWVLRPDVRFRRVDHWPDTEQGETGSEARGYRDAPTRAAEAVCVETLGGLGHSTQWMRGLLEHWAGENTYTLAPLELRLTASTLFARTTRDSLYGIARDALWRHDEEDGRFEFGRRAHLHWNGNGAVADALKADLAATRGGSVSRGAGLQNRGAGSGKPGPR